MITTESVISLVISTVRHQHFFPTPHPAHTHERLFVNVQESSKHSLKDNEETILAGATDPTVLLHRDNQRII